MTCKWPKTIPEKFRFLGGRINSETKPEDNPTIEAQKQGAMMVGDIDAERGNPMVSACSQIVHIGIFFDGTNNNRDYDIKTGSHTNVARLFEAFDEDRKRQHKLYIPGVGTPFKEIKEYGFSADGKAFATGFNKRIAWAYIQLLNRIYLAYGKPITTEQLESVQLDKLIDDSQAYQLATDLASSSGASLPSALQTKQTTLGGFQRDLHKTKQIKRIYLHIFGFSRGAAAARAFVHLLTQHWAPNGMLCQRIPFDVNFMGLFDTVASVGAAYSANYAEAILSWIKPFHGHNHWAKNTRLKIPTSVRRCVHYVAMHEQRASFPVDAIRKGTQYDQYPGDQGAASACPYEEVVYPGVHSDVGGGYPALDQGKSPEEGDQLSRIPLHDMYIAALEQGVPLLSGAAIAGVQQHFKLNPNTIAAFNAWLGQLSGQSVTLEAALKEGFRQNLAWRALRSRMPETNPEHITQQRFFKQAPQHKWLAGDLQKQVDQAAEQDPAMQQLKTIESLVQMREQPQDGTMRRLPLTRGEVYDVNELDQVLSKKTSAVGGVPPSTEIDRSDIKLAQQIRRQTLMGQVTSMTASNRLGEDEGDFLTNDQTDLYEATQDFRLLMAYVTKDYESWGAQPRPRPPSGPRGTTPNTSTEPQIARDTTYSGAPQRVLRLSSANVFQAASAALLTSDGGDCLIYPESRLQPHIQAYAALEMDEAEIHMLDNWVHDSRAWFRVPRFHEMSPGGYGHPRVLFAGTNTAVRYVA